MKGRKRHAAVDVLGLVLQCHVVAANQAEVKAAPWVLMWVLEQYQRIEKKNADKSYRGNLGDDLELVYGVPIEISQQTGKGGVAITYSAIALETESNVAIKVISLKQLPDWKEIELFQREAEVLAKLDHPAIPQYIDYFTLETEKDKAFYLVQQQAPGKSLAQLIENGWRTTETEVKNIAQQILEILIYLHSLDPPVIHRDIKPNNLIRSDEGKIYLVDFGAVQNTYYNTLMQGSTVVGTYGYMAPEQFRGKALPATDLYSLGATLLSVDQKRNSRKHL